MTVHNEVLDDHIAARISSDVKRKFLKKCGKLNKGHGEMIRSMILALNEGRLTIEPTTEEKELLK